MEPTDLNLTVTQREQCMVEAQVFGIYKHFSDLPSRAQTVMLELVRDKHIEYLTDGLQQLGSSFRVLDANRPWLCYWILHSLALLGEYVDDELENNAVDFLNRCQDPNGGYSGGPGQMPHLATTYAAVNALVTLGGQRSLSSINRDKLYTFLRRMKDPSGGFRMHEAGEIDVRACYTAISVASVLNILDQELVENVGNYILSCQTYEGGIAGEPGSEAHGGYTFCGLATMILIGQVHGLNITGLMNWVVFRQGVECGFQGRTNKLVDGCYSFWQGGVFSLIQRLRTVVNEQLVMMDDGKQDGSSRCTQIPVKSHASERKQDSEGTSSQYDESRWEQGGAPAGLPRSPDLINLSNIGLSFVEQHTENGPLFHSLALQQYILLCSQVLNGGFRDKPGKARDYYHTCYCLSGLSVCQYSCSKDLDSSPLPHALFGPYSNLVESVHPLYNIVLNRYHAAHDFFRGS
ncbi:hypothetical protein Nepgr_026308 [Nepenthes gracilis]|uniref:Protein farnesyltransferase subunit beta n=1 Tax=Nepenthes gracilis TaxID=150966 RepID=A0AAD3Y1X1_NEPGR|nr:hypothetical protein Nepgr_026308 [Nepenthes gracilis]